MVSQHNQTNKQKAKTKQDKTKQTNKATNKQTKTTKQNKTKQNKGEKKKRNPLNVGKRKMFVISGRLYVAALKVS